MANNISKVVRLNPDTLDLLDNYRDLLVRSTINDNLKKFVAEMSIDNIIYSALTDAYNYCTKSKVL